MAELDKTLVEELDEIDALFSRRNHLAPALSVAQISGTLRQLRQQPLPYRSIWHKQPSRVWSLVAVFLAFGFFLISTLVGNVRPSAAMEQLTPAFTNAHPRREQYYPASGHDQFPNFYDCTGF
jgi:hypothetical protein